MDGVGAGVGVESAAPLVSSPDSREVTRAASRLPARCIQPG
jgi:hypothetical protein